MNGTNPAFPAPPDPNRVQANSTDRPPGLKCELKAYEARYTSTGHRVALQVGTQKLNKPENAVERDHDSALVLTRFYNSKKDLEHTELEIKSPYVKAALQKLVIDYPGLNPHTNKLVIRYPPKCLFHYRQELREYAQQLQQDIARQHLSFCLIYAQNALKNEMITYCNLMESQLIPPGLDFPNLWMAFRPGDFIYMRTHYVHRVLKLISMSQKDCGQCPGHCIHWSWDLFAYHIDYDGRDFGRVTKEFHISPYSGYKPLSELDIFPLKYHPDYEKVRQSVIERGKKFISLQGVQHRQYHGIALALSSSRKTTLLGEETDSNLHPGVIKSRVIVDATTFGEARPTRRILLNVAGRIKTNANELSKLSAEDFLICHYLAPGFSLTEKRWCLLQVDRIVEVVYNSSAFDCLLLPDAQKQMIHSMVKVHTDPRLSFDDIIAGKGKGMVALLHGEPGVGKTLTAESVADYTRRPLYSVSSGELGVETTAVHANLSAALQLATTWNAIVLIDEADVFLEQRSTKDLERNGLVSIFLRILEYYEGIMFLTTNRISTFDAAFKSRIHVAIKYHALSTSSRRDIWKTFAGKASPNSAIQWMDDHFLDSLSAKDLNGRQIKNIVRTAHAMAVSSNEAIGAKHIESAMEILEEFERDFEEDAAADADRMGGHGMLDSSRGPKRRRLE